MAQSSLFEPAASTALEGASGWVEGVLFGEVALVLCSIAVALVGFLMLSGRLPLVGGARVVLGCFVLLGAPALAGVFLDAGRESEPVVIVAPVGDPAEAQPRGEVPPADYDPYSGASLRSE